MKCADDRCENPARYSTPRYRYGQLQLRIPLCEEHKRLWDQLEA